MSVRSASMSVMGDVFIGSEAITAGRLTRHELQRWYQPMFRGVYVSRRSVPTLWDRTVGAWLATRRHGVIAGNAASALHGAQWVDVDVAIELISPTTRPQHGLVIRRETLCDDEITRVVGLPVTTLARTAYDLGRHLSRGEAVARLDALMRATRFPATTCFYWPSVTRAPEVSAGCVTCCPLLMAAPRRPRRPGCGCC